MLFIWDIYASILQLSFTFLYSKTKNGMFWTEVCDVWNNCLKMDKMQWWNLKIFQNTTNLVCQGFPITEGFSGQGIKEKDDWCAKGEQTIVRAQ